MATSGLINIGGSSPTTELLQYSSVIWETATTLMATVPANGWTAAYSSMAVVPIGTAGMINNDPFSLLSGNTWVIKKAGKYSLHGVLGLTTPDAASVAIGKNGVQYKRIHIDPNNATAAIGSIDFDLGDLAINDIIEIRIVAHSTADLLKGISLTLEQKPTAIAPVVDTVAEYGTATLATTITANNNAGVWVDKLVTVTLPSAGTYKIAWQASAEIGDNGTVQTVLSGRLYNTTNNVAYSKTQHIIVGNDNETAVQTNVVGTGAGEDIVTVTGPTLITFQTKIDSLASAVVILLGDSSINGTTYISYEKIAGQLPSTGQSVDYAYARLTTILSGVTPAQQNTAAANIPVTSYSGNIPNSLGVFTLTAGKTYELSGKVYLSANVGSTATSYIVYKWVDSVTGNPLDANSGSGILTPGTSTGGTWSEQNLANLIYTPIVNQTVVLRLTTISSFTSVNIGTGNGANGETSITIKQLGSSAVIAGVYPGTATNYTPVVTSTTGTNPTLPTGATITGYYSVEGKMMTLNFKYFSATTTGGADGTQSYAYSIPAGYTIDLTKAAVPSVLTNTSGSGLDGGTIGTGFGRNSSLSAGLGVVPLSSTTFGFFFEGATRLVGAGALAATGAANTAIWATLQIPIL